MRSKRIQDRFQRALPTLQATFAFADVLVEATRRGLAHNSGGLPAASAPEQASGSILVLLGRELRRQTRRMLAAEDHYQLQKARQRRRRMKRDEIVKRGHALVVDIRKYVQGFYGWAGACEVLGLYGPTQREPRALHLQLGEAVWWARTWDASPESSVAGAEDETAKCLALLETLHDELDRAIAAVDRGVREVEVAMLAQREAMAEFDRTYKHAAGAIEAQLIQVGLPTLAAAVRPGVGRRGRPLKQRPADVYPDLVEQVRADGLVDLDVAILEEARNEVTALAACSEQAGNGSESYLTSSKAAGNGSKAKRSISTGARSDAARSEKSEHPAPERSGHERIVEHPLHEYFEGDEKSRQCLHEPSRSDGKSAQRVLEQSEADAKSELRVHEPSGHGSSALMSRLTLPPPVSRCGQDPRRRDLRRRPGGLATGRSSRERRQAAAKPSWWRRLLRVA